ncbi:monosaccharide ABC transporter ATP-binding protein (CUT2 family) [Mobilisporobacter senegalensis]|uniref:Monosaccharide ABC transporter ATP-binding protein (CUT2 family) n=1 Tax=Mobilisporobacter senegalensis TaxID=1329262 RepID=A0A3N1XPP7_9FIRM|nr:sugar ABC transporter ATP-binding protein [Mobilisporobacter senegalensis]ROR28659.1 monosaccharide ABC transporter ATP-binding protein (CUT2 family) [Mobilisporobacter senegalensis]
MEKYIVELEHITKSFPGVLALNDVAFNLKAGEVLALLGENGAGKSTLMKILSGVYEKDSGSIKIFGKEIDDMNPKKAQELGVAIIHQELNMCAHLTVAQNIFLGREKIHSGVLAAKKMNMEAKKILDNLNINIDPETIVGDLPVSKQQMVEIAKALSINAKILIMDEPTSALTSKEINDLFVIIKKLRSEGCGIVYISHRLEELEHIVDRVTILRDGEYITSMDLQETTLAKIISHMVGREIKEKFPRVDCERGEKIFEVRNLNAGKMVRDINIDLYAGEIVGIAGLMGAGRTETTRAIFGIDPKESGEIILDGKSVKVEKPIDAIKLGIVLAPEDRKKDGLCTKLSIRDNISLPNLDVLCNKLGVVNKKKEKDMTKKAVDDLRIKLPNSEVDAGSLSGGNQQKVVIGKWLVRNSRVVIFDEPTRGIDVAAKVEIYNLMNELKQQGIGVLFVSSEMPEVLGISDRIIVMCDGRITGELRTEEATQDEILQYATSFEKKVDNGANA